MILYASFIIHRSDRHCSMERGELAALLMAAGDTERAALLTRYSSLSGGELAYALKALYDSNVSSDPTRAAAAAAGLATLAEAIDHAEIQALAAWTGGMAALDRGQMEEAIIHLDAAEAGFLALKQPHTAAATQVSKLIALAMLGRYDEAIDCGMRARDVFLDNQDMLATGKIEQNLGNIYQRRDQYSEAERFLTAARERFVKLKDQKQLAQINNSLAFTLSSQRKFRAAALLYEQALDAAESAGLTVT